MHPSLIPSGGVFTRKDSNPLKRAVTWEDERDNIHKGFPPKIVDIGTAKNEEGPFKHEMSFKKSRDPNPLEDSSKAEEIFYLMAMVLKKNKISSEEAFEILDKDGDGKISFQELNNAFIGMKLELTLGLTREELEDVFKYVDTNNDGQIDYQEFVAALGPLNDAKEIFHRIANVIKKKNRKSLEDAFKILDKDSDGKIHFEELIEFPQMRPELTREEIEYAFNFYSRNRDGQISYGEFITAMNPDKGHSNLVKAFTKISEILKQYNIPPEEAFKIFDEDRDGKITSWGLRGGFAKMRQELENEEIDDIEYAFICISRNRDGQVSYQEFIAALGSVEELSNAEQIPKRMADVFEIFGRLAHVLKQYRYPLKEGFKFFDRDGDGKLNFQEFSNAFVGMGMEFTMEEIRYAFQQMDRNHDGQIDYEEFIAVFRLFIPE